MTPHPVDPSGRFRGRDALTFARRRLALLLPILLLLAMPTAAPAQDEEAAEETAPAEEAEATLAEAQDFSKPMGPPDPLNRGTPRGSIYGFAQAAFEGDWKRAAAYLDLRRLPPSEQVRGPDLARDLKVVLDQTVFLDYPSFSDQNAGHADDGLPSWRDPLATIETSRGPLELLLQRVPREEDGVRIWKVSAATVEQIPELYEEFGFGPLFGLLPRPFFEIHPGGVQLWQWIGLLGLVFVAWLLSWVLSSGATRLVRPLVTSTDTEIDDRLIHLLQGPIRLALGVVIFSVAKVGLGLPLPARERLAGYEQALLIVAFTWLLLQLVNLATLVARERLLRTQQASAVGFLAPGRRAVKAIIVSLAGIAMLDNLGFNVTALIAGLGVGGIAVALAAQKTIENLFGGATLFADQPVRVGDFCRFGDRVGTVEEIGLRSTRVRTLDRTVVTVPNGAFSALELENFARRDRILLHTTLGLRYETSPEQLRYVLARLREMLLAHPMIAEDPARVRFVSFGAYSLDLEVFAYARTADWNVFLQIREDVYLRMMDIVEEAGTGFAFPSTTTYLGRDEGLDEKQSRAAAERVESWRVEGTLPFPEFAREHRERVADTLDYPPVGSPDARNGGSGVVRF